MMKRLTPLAWLVLSPLLSADTIVLINGEEIHSTQVQVEKGRVYFRQLGGTISLPRREVARIVRDDKGEAPEPPANKAVGASGPAMPKAVPENPESAAVDPAIALDVGAPPNRNAAGSGDPESADAWRSQRDELRKQKAQIEQKVLGLRAQMILNIPDQDLRRDQGLEDGSDVYERQLASAQADLQEINHRLADLEDEARKAGALPDWNRE
jgi:hypothetical protein